MPKIRRFLKNTDFVMHSKWPWPLFFLYKYPFSIYGSVQAAISYKMLGLISQNYFMQYWHVSLSALSRKSGKSFTLHVAHYSNLVKWGLTISEIYCSFRLIVYEIIGCTFLLWTLLSLENDWSKVEIGTSICARREFIAIPIVRYCLIISKRHQKLYQKSSYTS